jgi:pectate lyase
MTLRRLVVQPLALPVLGLVTLMGCGSSTADPGTSGGAPSSGGTTSSGGQSAGGSSSGGAPSSGGQGQGGAVVSGGAPATSGGSPTSGGQGTSGASSGGQSATGGASAGGAASGGQATSGGAAGAASGGSKAGGAGGGGAGGASAGSGGKASGGSGGQVSGGSGGSSSGGSSSGGSNPGGAGPVGDPCIGWASVSAEGVAKTTGGEGGPVVQITTAEQLESYRRDPAPMILRIMNNLTGEFELGSNKTVEGANANITINGSLSFSGTTTTTLSNLIVRNLRINAVNSSEDGMDIRFAHHACVHNCEFIDGPDGNLDVVSEANYVTIAYNKFRYTSAWHPLPGETATNHRFSNLVGSSNTTQDDRGKLKVTFHHNWWAEGVVERMPRVRFGDVHVFNNYYSSTGNNYCVAGGIEARLLIENNFFENVKDPHIFYDGDTTAQIKQSGNEYVNATGLKNEGQGASFTPPYQYALDPGPSVKAKVMANVGPR